MTDPDMSNNTATDTDTLARVADLEITKTNAQEDVTAGAPLSFLITVRNLGPSDVTGASVADAVPAGLRNVQWTCTGADGGVCGVPSGSGSIAATVNLPANGVVVFAVTGDLDPAATGDLTNTATVTPPSGVTDPNMDNNTTTDSDPIVTVAVVPQAITLAATGGGPLTVKVGAVLDLTATVTLSNGTTQVVTTQAQWASNAPLLATVDGTGKVLGISPGNVTITATVNGMQGFVAVTVIPPTALGIAPAPAPASRPGGASAPGTVPGAGPTPLPLPPSRP
jgi:uncharacterized repeat protein (TIGR01451 family)